MAPTEKQGPSDQAAARRRTSLAAVAVVVVVATLCDARLWRPGVVFGTRENVQIAEAAAWGSGRLDLPERTWDTALKDGRVFNCFPPMFTFVAAALWPLFHGVPHPFVVFALALPVPLLAFVLMRGRTGSAWWGAVLTIGFVCGTSMWPVLDKTVRGASPYFVNHTLATIGLLIALNDAFARRRVWPAAIGLTIAALSRQLTLVYALPLLWCAWRSGERAGTTRAAVARVLPIGLSVALVAVTTGALNRLKFGSALDFGYRYLYVDRPDDPIARDAAAHGLFSWRFVPRNMYHANLGFPEVHRIEVAGEEQTLLRPSRMGTGIWWTTPLLLWLFVGFRRMLADPDERAWLIAAAAVYLVLLFYHNTGYDQRGFNRFSLDYLPVMFTLIAPRCTEGKGRWVSLVMVVWSVVYFRWMI